MKVVVDSSALLAILLSEPEASRVAATLEAAESVVVPAPTLVEATIVAEARLGPQGAISLQRLLQVAAIATSAFDEIDAQSAIDAWRRFGKGRHPASLNLGDCFAYALASRLRWPLLFVGDDFAKTDVQIAGGRGRTVDR